MGRLSGFRYRDVVRRLRWRHARGNVAGHPAPGWCGCGRVSGLLKPPSPTTPKQSIPRLQQQPLAADLAELAEFVGVEYVEGFAGVIGGHHIGWIEDGVELIKIENYPLLREKPCDHRL